MLQSSSIPGVIAALAVVIGMIFIVFKAAQSTGLLKRVARQGGDPMIVVCESIALDRSRNLHLVRWDGREVMLLTGGNGDLVVGWHPASVGPAQ
ncbi:MAG: hypothetical protein ACRYGM_10855 [Janthinobacterium lividum]